MALRWAILTAGLLLNVATIDGDARFVVATTLLLVNTAYRSLRPLQAAENRATTDALLLLDLGIAVLVVALTGGRQSPYVFVPVIDVLLAGFGRGYLEGAAIAAMASIGLVVVEAAGASSDTLLQSAGEIVVVYALAAVVAGYAHRLFVEVEERQEVAADVVTHLTEVNELLSDLHRVARTLPSSLDLGDTLAAATTRLHDLFDYTHLAVLVLEPATGAWRVEIAEGLRLPPEISTDALPAPLAEAVATRAACHVELPDGGFAPTTSSGLYAPLVTRDRLVGLLALEHRESHRYSSRHVRLVNGLAESLALAVDNALWFARLQSLGAEGERSRIARNLHDGVGQGLAYIALELDRIGAARPDPDLDRLRDETRAILRGVRETLHQLRAEVTEANDLRTLAQAHLSRFSERTGIASSLSSENSDERLPVLVEQELWRILQEALENVERHSKARRVEVSWSTDGRRGRLRVEDDGCGFDLEATRAQTAPGLRIMRERANAVGGRLDVRSAPGHGTTISVEVKVSR